MAYVEDTALASAAGASMVGIADGGTAQDWFDGVDLLHDAVGNGSTDDSAYFYGSSKDVIVLREGRTYYFGTSGTVTAKVVSQGGKIKRGDAVTVTFAGGSKRRSTSRCSTSVISPKPWRRHSAVMT